VTLVGESDRKMLKAAIKYSTDQVNVRHRIIPNEAVFQWSQQINALKDEVTEILQEEKEQKQVCMNTAYVKESTHERIQLRQAERDIKKGENLVEHEKEIFSRPARTWFQSVKDKAKSEGTFTTSYNVSYLIALGSSQQGSVRSRLLYSISNRQGR
jgi:ATP-dependent RNA helicase DDX27